MLEELKSRLIRHLKIDYHVDAIKGKNLLVSQLGNMITKSKLTPSPLLKYRGVSRIDPKTGEGYNIAIVVRQNGRWEVYSDFMLVYDWYDIAMQCVDIETDFNQFYLKFVERSHLIQSKVPIESLKFNVRQVRHFWRNRICFDTTKHKKNPRVWNVILHKRIAYHFKIYSQILNFQTFMLVSHRNMISVYKMSQQDGEWQTHSLEGGTIRNMFVK